MTVTRGIYETDRSGQRCYIIGGTRIRITEHFSPGGQTINKLMEELILSEARRNMQESLPAKGNILL